MFKLTYIINNQKPMIEEEFDTYDEVSARIVDLKDEFMDNPFKFTVYDPNGKVVQEGVKS